MQFVKETFTKTLEVKQSKFIAHLCPYSNYKETLQLLKESNPKARHFVVAYRYLNEFGQIVEHSSDDGEPKGTSGKPSLMVLQGKELVNTAVIIVRYFGGTKLGTGGLVRAYSDAVNLVLEVADFFDYVKEKEIKVSVNYSDVRLLEYECQNFSLSIYNKIFNDQVVYSIRGSELSIDKFLLKLKRVVCILEDE